MPKPNTERQLKFFSYGLPLLLLLLAWRHWHRAGMDGLVGGLLIAAGGLLLIAFFAKAWMKAIFDAWMKVAQALSKVVTALILILIYGVIFTPAGFIMRCLGKDFLSLKAYRKRESYWIKRPQNPIGKDRYKQQF